ncbi:MAG: hypothetical protein WB797_08915, partial [Nocardioides sp.]
MYEQFQRDPGSVDPSWASYFKANGSESPNGAPVSTNGTATEPGSPAAGTTASASAAQPPSA